MRYAGFTFALIVFSLLGYGFWFLARNMPEKTAAISHYDFQRATQASKMDGKPIILVFTASWCGPCQYMKEKVYPSPQVRQIEDRFHWIFVDTDQPYNAELKKSYAVHGIPHIEVVDGTGKSLGKVVGGYAPGTFSAFLKSTLPH